MYNAWGTDFWFNLKNYELVKWHPWKLDGGEKMRLASKVREGLYKSIVRLKV